MRSALPPVAEPAEPIGRTLEEPLEALQLELQLGTAEDVAVLADVHVADGTREVLDLLVVEPIGADHDIAAAQLDIALGDRLEIGPAAQFARTQDDRQRLRGVAARRGRERWRRAKPDAALFGRLRPRIETERRQRQRRPGQQSGPHPLGCRRSSKGRQQGRRKKRRRGAPHGLRRRPARDRVARRRAGTETVRFVESIIHEPSRRTAGRRPLQPTARSCHRTRFPRHRLDRSGPPQRVRALARGDRTASRFASREPAGRLQRCELPTLSPRRRDRRPQPDRDGRAAAAGGRAPVRRRRAPARERRPACAARARGRRSARLPAAHRPRQPALPRRAQRRGRRRRPEDRRCADARRDRGADPLAGQRRCGDLAAVRRCTAAARAGALSRMVRRPRVRRRLGAPKTKRSGAPPATCSSRARWRSRALRCTATSCRAT